MTLDKLHADLARLRAVLTSREPDLGQGLTVIDEHQPMLHGTTVRALQPSFEPGPSGLFVPTGSQPHALDLATAFLTPEEIFGAPMTDAEIISHLRRLPLEEVLIFIASVLADIRKIGVEAGALDTAYADLWFTEPTRTKVKNLLREPHRGLLVPQAFLVLAKLACFVSGDAVLPGVAPGNARAAVLGVAGQLGQGGDSDEQQSLVGTDLGGLGKFLLVNQHFNSRQPLDHLMARFARRWLQLPTERADDPQVLDLEATYLEVTGVPLRDVMTVAFGLWALCSSGSARATPTFMAAVGWSQERTAAALRHFTTDPTTLRGLVRAETRKYGLEWAFSTFEQFPVVQLEDGSYLVLDVDLLMYRTFGSLPLWDLVADMKDAPGSAARKRASKIEGCVRHLAELYAMEVLTSMVGLAGTAQRLYTDDDLKKAYRASGRRRADAAVDYGNAWVVVEVTTSVLTRVSVSGVSEDALHADIDKLVLKAEQIHDSIRSLREDESKLTGAPPVPGRRYFPLLVVAEGFPVNAISTSVLRERCRERALLTGPGVAPLEVVDVVELEMIEALQEQGGLTLREVLESKQTARLEKSSVRDYLLRELGLAVSRPTRLKALMDAAFEPAVAAFRPPAAA